jgi:hypothetical protein
MLPDTLDVFLNKNKIAKLLQQANGMSGEVTNQPSILAVPSPRKKTNKAVEQNGDGEATEKLQVVTSHQKKIK